MKRQRRKPLNRISEHLLVLMRSAVVRPWVEYAPQLIGLTLEEGRYPLAALQARLVQVHAEDGDHWRMNAPQQMRRFPQDAHLMPNVRTQS